jgi:hypothetical protein
LFPPRPGRRAAAEGPDPFHALLELGDRVSLDDYVRLDEAYVMSLMAEWRDADDPALAELVTCFKTRRFPKMVRLPLENRSMSRADWQAAAGVAHRIFARRFPDRDSQDYVHFDEPGRLSYKLYSAAGTAKPIRITTASGGSRPIESDPRSIANNLSLRLYFPRLFVPEAIRQEVEQSLGGPAPPSSASATS